MPVEKATLASDLPATSEDAPLRINSELFELILEPEWEQLSWFDNEDQFTFENKKTGMSLIFSTLSAEIPDEKIEDTANVLLNSQIGSVDASHREKGLYPVGVMEDVTSRSWGFQASLARLYPNGHLYRYFGLVTSVITINLTILGDNTPDELFNMELEKVLTSLRFEDEIWAGKPIPENTMLQ